MLAFSHPFPSTHSILHIHSPMADTDIKRALVLITDGTEEMEAVIASTRVLPLLYSALIKVAAY